MKNTTILLVMLGAALLTAIPLAAATETVDGITWTYTVSDGNAYVGGESSSSTAVPKSTSGAITIPSTLGGYPVMGINWNAFEGCSALTSVTIPDPVTIIPYGAFSNCGELTSVNIGSGVSGIEMSAFHGCSNLTFVVVNGRNPAYSSANGLLLSKDRTTLIMGVNGVVSIPNGVTSIGELAFEGCSGLASVTIPDSVTSIDRYAFYGCNGLTSVTIGNGMTSIGEYAFGGCSGLTSVTIPDSVTSIGSSAFSGCSGLTSVHISNLASWCGISFDSVSANPLYYAHHLFLNGKEVTELIIPDSVTSIGNYAFFGCSGLTSVTIPDSVTNIGDCAFYNCTNLTSVTIPDSVTNIGDCAFYNCTNLTSVTIPDSVMSIGVRAFYGCPAALFDTTTIPGLTLVDGWIVECETSLSDYDSFPGIRGIAEPLKADRERVSASFGEGRLVSSAIRAGDDLQINVTSDGVELPEADTTVSVRLVAKGGGETAINTVFKSAIRGGVILPIVITNIDFATNVGFITSVSNSLVSGNFGFGLQGMPEESAIAASVGCRGLSTDRWGETYPETWTDVTAASASGVMKVDYSCDIGQSMDADSWNSSNWNYSNNYYYNDLVWGLSAYEIGQPGEIGISMHYNEEIDWTQDGAQYHYRFDWMTFILPEDAPGFLYTPLPTIHKVTTEWDASYYDIGDWGNQNWGCGINDWWMREWQYYPLRYYHSWPSANEGEGEVCYYLDNALLRVPPYIKAHRVTFSAGDHLAVGYFKSWDDIDMSWASYFYGPYDAHFIVDDGKRYWQDSPLEYDVFSWYGSIDIYNGNGVDGYYGDVSLKGIYIPEDQIDYLSDSHVDYMEGRACIVAADGYYVAEIRSTPYYAETENDVWDEFVKFDPQGNVILSSGTPAFRPVTEDVIYTAFAAPIPYNITFVDELNAVNTNATTYTVEDCFDFAPPAEVGGWDFLGWDVSGVDHQTGDITVTAQWLRSDRTVTFNVGAHGSRAGGGELEQVVVWGEAAVPPEIEADYGWVFAGWDADISRVTESMTVTAQYERASLSPQEATGLDKAWTIGGDAEWFTEWSEDAHDVTNHLHSGAIGDGQESWIETVVTNTGVVSFWWKASSEAYRGIAYDKLIFTVDGEIPESVPPIGGEVDWTNVTLVVEGDGPHVLRWTYRKDASDSDGEDCAWLDDVQYLREVHVTFADGGATDGETPASLTVGEGADIIIPDQGSLAWPKHRFVGWEMGGEVFPTGTVYALDYNDVTFTAVWEEKRVVAPLIEVAAWYDTERTTVSMSCETAGAMIRYTLDGSTPTAASPIYAGAFNLAGSATIRAVAVLDDWFDSEIVSAVSVRAPWTPDECLNATGMVFRTGGDAEWRRDRTVAHDGDTAMRSGAIGDGQESWIETTVDGAGTLTFWWKASSEAYKGTLYDRARFTVDGVAPIPDIGGEADWRSESVMIAGNGSHVLRWTYAKDDLNTSGEDCAWLDEVTWTPNVTEEFVVDGVSVPASFLNEKYPALLEAANGDHMMALEATAANGVNKVWECYVAGLVPTNATDIFRSVISFENGAPVISWEPDLNEGGTKQERVYTVEGRESLTEGDWEELTIESGELKVDGYRFFRVKVALPSR